MGADGPRLVDYGEWSPEVDSEAFVADGATLVGAVSLAADASVWYSAVVRADGSPIEIGTGSNIQDGSVLHSDPEFPVRVGERCTVGDDSLVGMGAVLLNGVRLGAGCLVAAGTVVLEGTEVPLGSLVAGIPGKVKREVSDAERERIRSGAESYAARARRYRRTA